MNHPTAVVARGGLSPLIVACVAATWLIWGSTYLAIKFALVSLPPFFQMGTRFVVAGGALFAWALWRGAPAPTAVQWRNAALIGGLMLGCGMGGTAFAEQTVGSGLVVAFIAVGPLLIALLNLIWGIRPSGIEWLGILIGVAGVLMLTRGAGFAGSPAGLIAQSIAVVGWASGSVLSQRSLKLAPGSAGYASQMLAGGVLLLIVSAASGEQPSWPPTVGATLAWVYLVIAGTLIAFNAYMVLLANAPASLATSYAYVNPVIALMLGVAIGGEVVTGFEWMAAAIVLVGVVLLMWRRSSH